jgi:hypothetical protein
MSSDNVDNGAGKRPYKSLPDAVEHAILKALAANIRAYGNKRYDDVREHPDFAPWIGRAEGATGKKRFRRLVDKIAKPMPADRTKPHRSRDINEDQEAWAHQQLAEYSPSTRSGVPVSAANVMGGGLPTLRGLDGIERMLETSFADIERVRQAALVDDPRGVGGQAASIPELLLKVVGRTNATIETTLRVYDLYIRVVSDAAFYKAFMLFLQETLGDDSKFPVVVQGFRRLVELHGGLHLGEA